MKRNITILTDAISDLKIIDQMIARNRIERAKEELGNLFSYALQVRGGNVEVRNLMDKFQAEFGKRYAILYAGNR